MDDFLKMDIFFVVTTAIVFTVGLIVAVALVYVVRILMSVNHITKNISEESDNLKADVAHMRSKMKEEGFRWIHMSEFLRKFVARNGSRKKKSVAKDEE
jgi:hypothetical protein